MNYTDIRHHEARFARLSKKVAETFTPHKGKKPPIRGKVYIETVHRTEEGLAIGPRRRAEFVSEDEWALAVKKLGSISAWRLAPDPPPPPDGEASQT